MKKMKLLLICITTIFLLCAVSCKEERKQIEGVPFLKVEKDISAAKPIIIVNSVLVCRDLAFGFIAEGSLYFNIAESFPGYQILVKQNGNIVSTTYCPKNELTKYLSLVKYKISVKDSVVNY